MKKWMDKKPEINKLKPWQASWLAGVIDSEGSIGLYDYGKEGRRICIQMSNTNEEFAKEVRKIKLPRARRLGGFKALDVIASHVPSAL